MTMVQNKVSYVPAEGDEGQYTVTLGAWSTLGEGAVQTYQLTVLGSDLTFTTTPQSLSQLGRLYTYTPSVTDDNPGGGTLTYSLEYGPPGMTVDAASGRTEWLPEAEGTPAFATGLYPVSIRVQNQAGDASRQAFGIELIREDTRPQIRSTAPRPAMLGAVYVYDVEAFDFDGRQVLTYSLDAGPNDMTIDPVTGLIQWLPAALGSYQVTIRATDPFGQHSEQSYALEVVPDTLGPSVTLTIDNRHLLQGESTTITASALDNVQLASLVVTVDGVPVALDGQGQATVTATAPGAIVVIATATDDSGNATTVTKRIGVTDPSDTTAPSVTIHEPFDSQDVTLLADVLATIDDPNLLSWTLWLGDTGEAFSEHFVLAEGAEPVTASAIGTVDATRLVNGHYRLTLTAEDVSGNLTTVELPIRIDGGAKVGLVRLGFVDMVIPAPGFNVQVVRTYDTRQAAKKGDFGYGWELDLHGPQVRNNRPIGKSFAVWSNLDQFAFPCQEQLLQKPHYTEVRVSDTEWYVFSPFVANLQAVSGGCNGEVAFEQVDGSSLGASLYPRSDNLVRPSANILVSGAPPPLDLWRVATGTLYDENHFQLFTPDGRVLDITIENGLNWVQDANGNTLFLSNARVQHNEGTTVAFTKDTQNRIKALTSPDGTSVSYQYNTAGDLRVVTDAEGYQTRFDYASNPAHYLTRIIAPDGTEQALFTYDDDGRLVQSCGPESHCIENLHDLDTQTEWFIDGQEELRYTYDHRGNVLTETNALNETTTYTYGAYDRLATATSPLGEVTRYTYDRNGNVLSKEEPHEAGEPASDFITTYTYDSKNHRTGMTMPSGGSFAWTYDANGNELTLRDGTGATIRTLTRGQGGRVASETTRFGTTTYGYQFGAIQLAQPTTVTDPFGRATTFAYDGMGRVTRRTEGGWPTFTVYDKNGRVTSQDFSGGVTVDYQYDSDKGQWTSITGPTFGRVTRQFYDDGKLARVVEPSGDSRQYFYDARRRLEREVDELGNVTEYVRDLAGRVTEVQEQATGAVTQFSHDAAGRVTSRTDALNHATSMTYKAGGRLESMTDAKSHTRSFDDTPTSRTVVDALSRTTVRQLSQYGLTTGTSLPGGTSTSLSYLGNTRIDESQRFPLSVTDEGSRPRTYGYDAQGGMTSATDLGGANGWQYSYELIKSAQLTWDAESGQVGVVPVDGRASAYEFSSSGGAAYGDVSSLSSDATFTSELRTVTTPSGDVTTFSRDSVGRPSSVTLPWGAQKQYLYTPGDSDVLPDNITLPQGTQLAFTYDAAKREVRRTSNAGESRSFTYGAGDRLASMTDATGTTLYEYDAAGRFSGIVYPHSGSVRYQRDLLGRVTRQEVRATAAAVPEVTLYSYDEVGNLETVTDPLGGVTTFVYDAENRLTTRTLPNGVVTAYTYDDRDRPLRVVHTNAGGTVLASRAYVRGPGGEPTRITKEDGSYVVVGYDAALRIASEQYFDAGGALQEELTYTYDADGNRTSKVVNGTPDSYTYVTGARMTSAGTSSYGYDNAGRVTTMSRADGAFSLTYDSDDHVTQVVKDGVSTSFGFDAMGRRTRVTDAAGTKRYLTAPSMGAGFESPQMVVDDVGAPVASFVFAGEHPLMKIVDGEPVYYLGDTMGSVIGFANDVGASAGTFEYDGFGNARGGDVLSTDTAGDFRFQGMWKDPSGLYYARARVYEAETGRFTSRDPDPGRRVAPESYLPYGFCQSNPALFRDPSGRYSLVETAAVAGAVSALAATAIAQLSGFLKAARIARAELELIGGTRNASSALATLLEAAQPGSTQGSAASKFFERGNLSVGVDLHGSLVTPITPWGAILGVNRQWFYNDLSQKTYCYSDAHPDENPKPQAGLDVGVAAQSVWAYGSGDWTGEFKSVAIGGGILTGSVFWSPGWSESGVGWVGFTYGFAWGLPYALAYESTYYDYSPEGQGCN